MGLKKELSGRAHTCETLDLSPQQHRTGRKGREGLDGGKGKGKEWKGEVANINRVSTMNENFPVLTLSCTTVTLKNHCFCLN